MNTSIEELRNQIKTRYSLMYTDISNDSFVRGLEQEVIELRKEIKNLDDTKYPHLNKKKINLDMSI